jgi:hypothetical protein
MSMSRRSLLQYTGAGCALALLPSVASAAATLRRYKVQDAVALPRFAAGDVVVADTAITRFGAPGLYLYPAWGQPRLYAINARADRLEFRNPGSLQLLWTQSRALAPDFAGKVLEGTQATALPADCSPLSVPLLPPTA